MYRRNFFLVASLSMALACSASSIAQDTENLSVDIQTDAVKVDELEAITEVRDDVPVASTISNDFNLPVTLDSKSQALDGKNKTSIFIDNVVIRQGSLELLADKVEVDAVNGAGREVIIASGVPASYKQRKDDGSMVQAQANEIVYLVDSRTISLKGNALIMQNEVRVTGDMIVFDMTKEQILASTDDGSTESVRTVISPGALSVEQPLDTNQGQQKQ